MSLDGIEDYLNDDIEGGSDVELICATIKSLCDDIPLTHPGVGFHEAYGDACTMEPTGLGKRIREETCGGPKSKACREKMRRDKLNDRFMELSSVLDPGRPPKSDKATILSDAARVLAQLTSEAQELKESNEKLQEAIKDLKAEKNEIREEKMRLKADKERLEQNLKAMSLPAPGFMPHPIALHPAAVAKKAGPPFAAFPGMAMWQWLPPAVVDTTQDAKFWSPNA